MVVKDETGFLKVRSPWSYDYLIFFLKNRITVKRMEIKSD